MAGIYLHIPFCRKICGYCDFFKNASLKQKNQLLEAMKKELMLRKKYLQEPVETIYFGGGTPSILTIGEIAKLLEVISKTFNIARNPEITFEANPDDLDTNYLQELKSLGINRLSIGIQSFDDKVLQFMNRRHSAQEAVACVQKAKAVGFENLSLDIIYGIPHTDVAFLQKNLQQLCELEPIHISAYHLTIEQGTPFAHLRNKGKLREITDENSEKQYLFLVQYLYEKGYEQYEISNFCKDGRISKHNTSYWQQISYLGIGASAHSYNQTTRHWNVANLKKYIEALQNNQLPCEVEQLSEKDKFNDYMMVRLRTKWGVDLDYIQNEFGSSYVHSIEKIVRQNSENFEFQHPFLALKKEAFLRSDYFIAKFFVT